MKTLKNVAIVFAQILLSSPVVYYMRELFGIKTLAYWIVFLLVYLVNFIIYKRIKRKYML